MQKLSAFLLIILVILVFLSGCTDDTSDTKKTNGNDSTLKVAVSILPEKEFAEAVGGEKISVSVLIPPGASPHTYELTSGQLRELSQTDIYAVTGFGIEFELAWMNKIAGVNPDMKIINLSEGVDLISSEDEESGTDPHIWLSLKNVKIMSENLCEGLVNQSPEDEQYFRENLNEYELKLDSLDNTIKKELSEREDETILVYHPAWQYFASDYSLNLISVENEGKDPSPAELAEIIDTAKIKGIKVVFASPEYSTKSAEVIANAINGNVVLIDPLSENYLLNMEYVAKAFASE
ncbi:MAG: zinc ABC transporter substrate-binding protein [Methanomicrobium sp.]|nr:zinc ABC transporter substrate-binding protein [Methanomicrobium sp.]